MQGTQVQSLSQEDPLEKRKATHCSILAWRSQWTEEPGELQSMGLQRLGHGWVTSTFTFTFRYADNTSLVAKSEVKVLISGSCLTLYHLWTVAYQAPLSMEFSRQEYWSG